MTARKNDMPLPTTANPQKPPARGKLDHPAPEPEPQDNTAKGRKGG